MSIEASRAAGRPRLAWVWMHLVMIQTAATALAHEGHQPLPSKGVQVDTRAGTLFVSRLAVEALQIEVTEAILGTCDTQLLSYARLLAPWNGHAFVAPGIGGRVAAVYVKPGETVRQGQPLALIESLQLETIQLETRTSRTQQLLAEQTLTRLERLAAMRITAARELGEARAVAEHSRVATAVAEAKLRMLGVPQDQIARLLENADGPILRGLTVTSPLAGAIVHGDVTVGSVVAAENHLFEIVDNSEVWVKIDVLERDVAGVRVGQSVAVTLTAYPDSPVATIIDAMGSMLDPRSHVGTVWAKVSNPPGVPPRFVPGMHGTARIAMGAAEQRVAVPAEAVVNNGLEQYVLVEEAATARGVEYRRQNVVVEGAGPGMVLLRDGSVYPGDRVVTQGSHELSAFFINGILTLSPEAEVAMGLEIATLEPHPVEDVLEFDGAVDVPPGNRAAVATQIGGRISTIRVVRGNRVMAGELLAEISSLEVLDMQLALGQAAARRRLDADSLARLRSLDDPQSVPQKRFMEAEAAVRASVAQVDALARNLLAIGMAAEDVAAVSEVGRIQPTLAIRAPIAGSVVGFDAVLGQVVKAEEPLLEIHDPGPVWVRGYLTERDFGRLVAAPTAPPARVRFVAAPDRVLTGRVVRSGNVFGVDDRTLAVWVELDKPDRLILQHNMLARTVITLAVPAPVLAVPVSAVVGQGTRSHVFVRLSTGVFVRRAVELGRRDDRFVAITSGVAPGEQVVVSGASGLQTAFASIR